MRLFIGIPLADVVVDELSAISARLKSDGDRFRWTLPESWHITLQFLGNSSREQYECVVAQLRTLHLPPVSIGLERFGSFDHDRIFLAAVHLTPELLSLQKQVTAATEPCGFVPEARPYQPHITLARSKDRGQRQNSSELKDKLSSQPNFSNFVAKEFLLYESFLGRPGLHYEVRARFLLDGR
jgi:2'-5' RNA ligase